MRPGPRVSMNPHELDNEALAFKPLLGSMLARIYHNPQNKEANQTRLKKKFYGSGLPRKFMIMIQFMGLRVR